MSGQNRVNNLWLSRMRFWDDHVNISNATNGDGSYHPKDKSRVNNKGVNELSTARLTIRKPHLEDGAKIWKLVKDSGVLDVNSSYSYLMLCKYFQDTCAIAEEDGKAVGFVTGFRPPSDMETLFVWQIAVDPSQRGRGLASKLIQELLKREPGAKYITATISPSNKASQALFKRLASDLNANIEESASDGIPEHIFPEGGHEAEHLFRIGPIEA